MSRIGKKPVTLPKGVKVTVTGSEAVVEGAKGKLSCPIPAGITLDVQADSVVLSRVNDEPQNRAYHGLARALLGCTPAKSFAARPARPGSKGNPWRTTSKFDATRPRPASAAA